MERHGGLSVVLRVRMVPLLSAVLVVLLLTLVRLVMMLLLLLLLLELVLMLRMLRMLVLLVLVLVLVLLLRPLPLISNRRRINRLAWIYNATVATATPTSGTNALRYTRGRCQPCGRLYCTRGRRRCPIGR